MFRCTVISLLAFFSIVSNASAQTCQDVRAAIKARAYTLHHKIAFSVNPAAGGADSRPGAAWMSITFNSTQFENQGRVQ